MEKQPFNRILTFWSVLGSEENPWICSCTKTNKLLRQGNTLVNLTVSMENLGLVHHIKLMLFVDDERNGMIRQETLSSAARPEKLLPEVLRHGSAQKGMESMFSSTSEQEIHEIISHPKEKALLPSYSSNHPN